MTRRAPAGGRKQLTPEQLEKLSKLKAGAAAKDEGAKEEGRESAAAEEHEIELSAARFVLPAVDNSKFRGLSNCAEVADSRQDAGFTVPVNRQFARGAMPEGQILDYAGNNGQARVTNEELREKDRLKHVNYDYVRQASEVHRQTRRYMHGLIRPGMTTLEIAQLLENKSKELIALQGLEGGWAFPTGLSLNHCAAHYTPNYSEDPVVLTENDIMKIDFGIHVKGHLVDSAWTVCFNEKFDPLVEATKDATNTGLKECGIDMNLGELGGIIEEVITSYEVEVEPGKGPVAIKPVRNLSGHSIEPYRIHAGKSVPIVRCYDADRMEEGEQYAIETFASTGQGKVHEEGACSHYMVDYAVMNSEKGPVCHNPAASNLLKTIASKHHSLAFCRRWLDDYGCQKHLLSLKALENLGIVNAYPPLCDVAGSYTSQMEHTVLLRPTCKEIISRGDDY